MSVTSGGELMALLSKCPFPSTPLGVLDWSCWFLVFFFHSWTPLTWTQWTPTLSLTPLFLGNSNKIGSEKGVFRLVTGVGRKKILSSHEKSNPTTFGFRAPMLYHWATGNLRWTRSITKFMWHASCILPWSAMSSLNMKATFAVMNTTWAVVKIRPKKKIQARTGFEPVTFAIPVSQRSWVNRFKSRIGLNFFTAQVVFITTKMAFIFTSLSVVQIYDFHIFTVV